MDFEQRIQVLEDIEAIRKLKAAYCAACDDDHNGDAVAALFVPDATWGAAGRDPEMGQGEIRDFMFGVRNRAQMARSAHQVFNPVIGTYDETDVRTDGGWKFQSLEVTIEERGVYATAEDGPI